MADVRANSMACHPRATCYIAGCFHSVNSLSWFHSRMPYCRVLPYGEFNVMIPVPCATLQGEVTWRNQCHDRATLQGVRTPSAILKIVFCHFFVFCFNAVWALTSGGFRIISDTLVRKGALKMTDMKLQDMKLTDRVAGHEIAGHENGGPNSRTWKCKTWNWRTK